MHGLHKAEQCLIAFIAGHFRQFHLNVFGRDIVLFQHCQDLFRQIRIFQVHLGEIHGDAHRFDSSRQPVLDVLADTFQYIEVQLADAALSFQHRNEVHRRHHDTVPEPAHQCLAAAELVVRKGHLRLIEHLELLVFQSIGEHLRHFFLTQCLFQHRVVKVEHIRLSGHLCHVHCSRCGVDYLACVLVFPDIVYPDSGAYIKGDLLVLVGDRHILVSDLFQQVAHMLFFRQQHKVVTAHPGKELVFLQHILRQTHKFTQYHIAFSCAYRTVDVVEILDVHECAGVVFQFALRQKFAAGLVDATGVQRTGQQVCYGNAPQQLYQLDPFQHQKDLVRQELEHFRLGLCPCGILFRIKVKDSAAVFVHLHLFFTRRRIKSLFALIDQITVVLPIGIHHRFCRIKPQFKFSQRKNTCHFLHLILQQSDQIIHSFHILLQRIKKLLVTLYMKIHIHTNHLIQRLFHVRTERKTNGIQFLPTIPTLFL